eukprot:TRINITY_DN36908_c0_g1_i2.p1 TRINITY_DN36908_c0_g1~~TRINITY_DN36908_c0_g1_i2.p1  ORF type:complete len:218 (+),score=41.08 TRINITY_DN36908_c0_g1_i2:177-830(+)
MCIRDSINAEYMGILFIFIAVLANSLNVQLENQEFCITSRAFRDESLCIHYIISGQQEKNVIMNIYDGESTNTKPIHTSKLVSEYKYTLKNNDTIDRFQTYKICFISTDSKKKVLTFDVHVKGSRSNMGSGDILATKSNMNQQIDLMSKTFNNIEKIYRNQRYQSIRQQTHQEIMQEIDQKIKWCSLFKVFIIIIICITQISIIKGYFKKDYQKITV